MERTDREMLERETRPRRVSRGRELTRCFEPADYERAASFIRLAVSHGGSTAARLSASILAGTLAEQFAWDYDGFDRAAFTAACRTGARYLPDLPDESDERARAELEASGDETYEDVCLRIELIPVGPGAGEEIFRYLHQPQAEVPAPRLAACEAEL